MSIRTIYGVDKALRYESPFQKMLLFKETAILVEDITTKISHIFVRIIDSAIEENNICEYNGILGLLCSKDEFSNRVSLNEMNFNFLSTGYIYRQVNDILHKPIGFVDCDANYDFVVLFGYCFPNRISELDMTNFIQKVNVNYPAKIYDSVILDRFVGCAIFSGHLSDDLAKIKAGFKVSDYDDWQIKDLINKYADEFEFGAHVCGPPMLLFELIY